MISVCKILILVGNKKSCERIFYANFRKHSRFNNWYGAGKAIAKGCSAVVYAAKLKKAQPEPLNQVEQKEFPFAIKMMFNYHAESNAFTILRAMQR